MSGAIPPLPHYAFMAWCSFKAQDNFTFTFTGLEHGLDNGNKGCIQKFSEISLWKKALLLFIFYILLNLFEIPSRIR
jgi:hypothetical protein